MARLPLAVQLYSLRHLPHSLDGLLAEVAAIGYAGVETIGDHGISSDQMKALLSKHQLTVVSSHVGLHALETDADAIIAFNQAIGNRVLTIPAIPQDERPSDAEGWRQLGARLDALGRRCATDGMRLLYHNHAWEMIEFDGKRALEWLFSGVSLTHLAWEPDLAWIVRGGADPVELLRRYSQRCPRVHVKDVAPEGENKDEMGFADVGHGVLDWDRILPACRAAGAEWYIVEHDLPKEPMRTLRRSYEFLTTQLTALGAA